MGAGAVTRVQVTVAVVEVTAVVVEVTVEGEAVDTTGGLVTGKYT